MSDFESKDYDDFIAWRIIGGLRIYLHKDCPHACAAGWTQTHCCVCEDKQRCHICQRAR